MSRQPSVTRQVLHEVAWGALSPDETVRRLEALIEAEITRTDAPADMALVDACQSLLWQLHTHGALPYDSHESDGFLRLQERIAAIERRRRMTGRILRWSAVAAAAVLLLLGATGNLHWFGQSAAPGQQHIVQRHEITGDTIAAAMAKNELTGNLIVTNFAEFGQILGFDPCLPQTLGDGWQAERGSLHFLPGYIKLNGQYEHPQKGRLVCTIHYFTDMELSYYTFEQSREGDFILHGGREFYLTEQEDRTSVSWNSDVMLLHLSSESGKDEALALAAEILDGR